jgi:hypothetical protein
MTTELQRGAMAGFSASGCSAWIDIADKTPEIGVLVLFICDCGLDGWTDAETGRWTGQKTAGNAIVMDYGDDPDWYPCTHWLPIPPSPNSRTERQPPVGALSTTPKI